MRYYNKDIGQIGIRQDTSSAMYDAFGRYRTSDASTVFYSSFQYGLDTLVFNRETAGTATINHDVNSSSMDLSTVADGDDAIIQSIDYLRYQPGKSHLIKITACFNAADGVTTKRAGYFDDNNGLYVRQSPNGDIAIVKRSSSTGTVSELAIDRSAWNTYKMPGFDFTKTFIFFCDIEWLGVGTARCGFVQNGRLYYCHAFHHAGLTVRPYMQTASLPVRWQITQSGAGSGTMKAICSAVDSEGGTNDELAVPHSIGNNTTLVSVGTTETPILAVRPKTLYQGVINRRTTRLDSFSGYAAGGPAHLRAYITDSVTGGSWANVSTNHSSMEFNVTPTGFGTLIAHQIADWDVSATATRNGRQALSVDVPSRAAIGLSVNGSTQSTMVVVTAKSFSGTVGVSSNIQWRELS